MRVWLAGAGLLTAVATWTSAVGAVQYTVDPAHTSVTFQVRHLFTQVSGRFDRFSGTIDFDPAQPAQAKVAGSIEAASISTNNDKRDQDLRSSKFFDVEKFPTITFTSTAVPQVDAAKLIGKMDGKLTIHGVERPIVIDVAYLGAGKDPWGKQRAGFSGRTTINRKDFGLTWNQALETGGVLVGDEVTIDLQIEAVAGQ